MNPGTGHTSEFMGFPRPHSQPLAKGLLGGQKLPGTRSFLLCGQRAMAACRQTSQGRGGYGTRGTHCWGRDAQKGRRTAPGGGQSSATVPLPAEQLPCLMLTLPPELF